MNLPQGSLKIDIPGFRHHALARGGKGHRRRRRYARSALLEDSTSIAGTSAGFTRGLLASCKLSLLKAVARVVRTSNLRANF
jgi:hypothetical protein